MKRKGSRDDFGLPSQLKDSNHLNTGMQKHDNQSSDSLGLSAMLDTSPDSSRPRSLRISHEQPIVANNGAKTSMMDMLVLFQCICLPFYILLRHYL